MYALNYPAPFIPVKDLKIGKSYQLLLFFLHAKEGRAILRTDVYRTAKLASAVYTQNGEYAMVFRLKDGSEQELLLWNYADLWACRYSS